MTMGKNSNAAGHIKPDRVIRLLEGLRLFAESDILLGLRLTFPGEGAYVMYNSYFESKGRYG